MGIMKDSLLLVKGCNDRVCEAQDYMQCRSQRSSDVNRWTVSTYEHTPQFEIMLRENCMNALKQRFFLQDCRSHDARFFSCATASTR